MNRIAYDALVKYRNKMKQNYNKQHRQMLFDSNDLVWVKTHSNSKLFKKRIGPNKVISRGKREGNYIIEDIEGNQKELHESELTLYQVEQEPNPDRILKFVEESLFKKREKENNETKRKNVRNKEEIYKDRKGKELPHQPHDIKQFKTGQRVAVWWPYDRKYYEGIVRKIKGRGKNRKNTIWNELKLYQKTESKFLNLSFPSLLPTTSTNKSSFGNIYDK